MYTAIRRIILNEINNITTIEAANVDKNQIIFIGNDKWFKIDIIRAVSKITHLAKIFV